MITSADIQKRRSPSALRDFVKETHRIVCANKCERHRGIMKAGLYKKFLDEIVPLSHFALHIYPESYEVEPILGNQPYDALVWDQSGAEVDRIELTVPHDGKAAADDALLTVTRDFGGVHVYAPGDDFMALFPFILATCEKKAMSDYRDCSLVVAIREMFPIDFSEALLYKQNCEALALKMRNIEFTAKRVFLLVLPDYIRRIC